MKTMPKAQLKEPKTECFAYDPDNTCRVTECRSCNVCPFYKTQKQVNAERMKTEKNIEEKYGIPYSTYLQSKGYAK